MASRRHGLTRRRCSRGLRWPGASWSCRLRSWSTCARQACGCASTQTGTPKRCRRRRGVSGWPRTPAVLQHPSVVIEAAKPLAVRRFWRRALDCAPGEDGGLADPLRRDPAIRIRQSTEPRPLRNRFHLDVVRPAAAVEQTSLGHASGPYGVRHTDPDGNEVDLVPGDALGQRIGTADWQAVFSAQPIRYRQQRTGHRRIRSRHRSPRQHRHPHRSVLGRAGQPGPARPAQRRHRTPRTPVPAHIIAAHTSAIRHACSPPPTPPGHRTQTPSRRRPHPQTGSRLPEIRPQPRHFPRQQPRRTRDSDGEDPANNIRHHAHPERSRKLR